MTAVGSPTVPRNLRMALLAKICAATSRCAARPAATAGSRRCAARGSASTDAPPAASWTMSSRVNGTPHLPTAVLAVRSAPGFAIATPGRKRRCTASLPGMKRQRRGRERGRRQARAGRKRIGQTASGEDCRQPRDVDRFGRDERVRQRERVVPGQRAVLAQDCCEARRVRERRRAALPSLPAPSRPTTITSGSANTVTSSADPSPCIASRHAASSARQRCRATPIDGAPARTIASAGPSPPSCARSAPRNSRSKALCLPRRISAKRVFRQPVNGARRLRGRRKVGKDAGIRGEECGFGQGQSRSRRQFPSLTVISTRPRSSKPE